MTTRHVPGLNRLVFHQIRNVSHSRFFPFLQQLKATTSMRACLVGDVFLSGPFMSLTNTLW